MRCAAIVAVLLHVAANIGYGQTLTASWNPSPEDEQVSNYQVCIGTFSYACDSSNASVPASQTSYTFTPSPGILYYVAVRGVSAVGTGSYTAEIQTSIPSVIPPGNQTSTTNTAIEPLRIRSSDPDGGRLQFSHSGLPVGLTLDPFSGLITGTPTAAGTYNVSILVSDGLVTTSGSFLWTVVPPAPRLNGLTGSVGSPQAPGTPITFTASASGGLEPYQFKWFIFNGTTWATVRDWGGATYTWTPTVANGNYRVGVWVRSAGSTDDTGSVNLSIAYPIISGASAGSSTSGALSTSLRLTGIASNLASPQRTGTTITFTAMANGGTAPYQFKWFIWNGTTWTTVQEWSNSATYVWTPTVANASSRVGVWARSAGSTDETGSVNLSIAYSITSGAPSAGLRLNGITSNLASPQMRGTTIAFTATASGGVAPYQFKWFIWNGTTWTTVQDWSNSATYMWTPTVANANARVGVWARSAGSIDDTGSVNLSIPYSIYSEGRLIVSSLRGDVASPQTAGRTITFTATASGGTAPYQFKWFIWNGVVWTTVRDWSTSATLTWTPTTPNTDYRVGVWARSLGSTDESGSANLSIPYPIIP